MTQPDPRVIVRIVIASRGWQATGHARTTGSASTSACSDGSIPSASIAEKALTAGVNVRD